jgi:hypothetical protein
MEPPIWKGHHEEERAINEMYFLIESFSREKSYPLDGATTKGSHS